MAIHKRAACIVIANMSKLVNNPRAVAPFGSLLVPELKKVTQNVQFEEIRDEALRALSQLTKALGDLYSTAVQDEENASSKAAAAAEQQKMKDETSRIEAEQERIKKQRDEEAAREEALRLKEEEEKVKFKQAMDAQRELDRIAFEDAQKKKAEEDLKKEKAKLSTKGGTGKCQGCGLKKCKKSCMFYGT